MAADQNVVELGGESRQLLINYKSAKALTRVTGEGLRVILRKLRNFDFDALERTIWAALLHAEPTLTLSLTIKRIDAYVEEHGTAAPLFIAATQAVDDSGLFRMPTEEEAALGKDQATVVT